MINTIIDILDELSIRDQELRKSPNASLKEIEGFDKKTTKELKKIITEIGWPTISKVGKKASHQAWLLLQHSRDKRFVVKCFQMISAVKNEVDKKDFAFLTDKVLIDQGKKQRFGTIVETVEIEGEFKTRPLPIEDESRIDSLRKEMDLEPLQEQLDRCQEMFMRVIAPKLKNITSNG